jgi:hypothetical protein
MEERHSSTPQTVLTTMGRHPELSGGTMEQEIYNGDGTPNPAGLIGKTITSIRELDAEERVTFKGYEGLVCFECDDQTQIFGNVDGDTAVGQKIVEMDDLDGESSLPHPVLEDGRIIIVVNVFGWVSQATFDAIEARTADSNLDKLNRGLGIGQSVAKSPKLSHLSNDDK